MRRDFRVTITRYAQALPATAHRLLARWGRLAQRALLYCAAFGLATRVSPPGPYGDQADLDSKAGLSVRDRQPTHVQRPPTAWSPGSSVSRGRPPRLPGRGSMIVSRMQ